LKEFIGSGRSTRTNYEILKPYAISTEVQIENPENFSYIYEGRCAVHNAMQRIQTNEKSYILLCNIPLSIIANILTSTQANEVSKEHNLHGLSCKSLIEKQAALKSHICTKTCTQCFTLFKAVKKNQKSIQQQIGVKSKKINTPPKVGRKSWGRLPRAIVNRKHYTRSNVKFPPSPPSKCLMHKIITGFCNDTHPSKFEEAGCAVCGQLVVISHLVNLKDIKCSFDPLVRIGVTRLPRNAAEDPIKEISGPIIDTNCRHVCHECFTFLKKKSDTTHGFG